MTEQQVIDTMIGLRRSSGVRFDGALYPSRKALEQATRRALLRAGLTPVRATYDDNGECTVCGESGRCNGYHARGDR